MKLFYKYRIRAQGLDRWRIEKNLGLFGGGWMNVDSWGSGYTSLESAEQRVQHLKEFDEEQAARKKRERNTRAKYY